MLGDRDHGNNRRQWEVLIEYEAKRPPLSQLPGSRRACLGFISRTRPGRIVASGRSRTLQSVPLERSGASLFVSEDFPVVVAPVSVGLCAVAAFTRAVCTLHGEQRFGDTTVPVCLLGVRVCFFKTNSSTWIRLNGV